MARISFLRPDGTLVIDRVLRLGRRLPPAFLETAAIFAVFALQGAWPAPAVNEPYYLTKALHFWNPSWAAGDFFLGTADAHQVFYFTFGWLALWLPLPVLAWVGRLVTWGLLAWAWRRLSRAVTARPWMAVLSAGLFSLLVDRASMAGEWVIGGVEAKGFAYVLVFLGLEAVVRGRWGRAWLIFGAAGAFHVLVGGWWTVAAGLGWLMLRALGRRVPRLLPMLPYLAGGLILFLPGLIPSLALSRGVDPAVAGQAHEYYVVRLFHHLDAVPIARLTPWLAVRFAGLALLWLGLCWGLCRSERLRRLAAVVHATLALALLGTAISVLKACEVMPSATADAWLRLYWFRASDVAVPLGVALAGTAAIARGIAAMRPQAWLAWALAAGLIGLHLADYATIHLAGTPQFEEDYADEWLEACQWIVHSGKIPADARFIAPRLAETFKWHTGRPEVVNWKEIPQDARGIAEWWERMVNLYEEDTSNDEVEWFHCLAEREPAELTPVLRQYQADYLLTYSTPRLPYKVMFRNDIYAIYRLPRAQR